LLLLRFSLRSQPYGETARRRSRAGEVCMLCARRAALGRQSLRLVAPRISLRSCGLLAGQSQCHICGNDHRIEKNDAQMPTGLNWEAAMQKKVYFDVFEGPGWPELKQLAPYFLAPKGQEWSYRGGNDSWGLEVQGLEGTDGMARLDQV